MKKLLYTFIAIFMSASFALAQNVNNKRVIIHLSGDDTPYSFITSQVDSITFVENAAEATVTITSKNIKEKSATIDFELTDSERVIYACIKSESAEEWNDAQFISYLRNNGTATSQKSIDLKGLELDTEYTIIAAAYDKYNAMCAPSYHHFATASIDEIVMNFIPEFQSIKRGERATLELYTDGHPYDGDIEVKWEISNPTSLVHLGEGIFLGIGYGTNIVKASIGENYAVAQIEVTDSSIPTEYDQKYLLSPYPYLEYPTTRERVMAAEAASKSQGFILRYPVSTDGDIMAYKLCEYFGQGPSYIIFSNTFYNLNPGKGEPIAWGYMQGVKDESMYPVVSDIFTEFGFEWVKNITLENGTVAAWHKNETLDRSCLVYVRPYDSDPSQKYGVAEFRVLSDDPNYEEEEDPGQGTFDDDLPMGFDKWGATPEEIKAYEAEQGSTLNENPEPNDKRKIVFDIVPTTENEQLIRRDYLFTDNVGYSNAYYYFHTSWLKEECGYLDKEGKPTAAFKERLEKNGYKYVADEDNFYNAERQVQISFQYLPGFYIGFGDEYYVGVNFKYMGERTR